MTVYRMRELMRFVLIVFAVVGLAACTPPAAPAPQVLYAETSAAIDVAFPEPHLNATARCIAGKESGGNPLAVNGQYRGVYQLGSNYNGSISVTNDGNVWNPLTNSLVARIILNARGNWSAWSVARACGVR